jgi:hypothetical protein
MIDSTFQEKEKKSLKKASGELKNKELKIKNKEVECT